MPQNEAFLSAVRNAQDSVFIQSPDVNAEPIIPALIDAAKRGVQVVYYFCLGYNDMVRLPLLYTTSCMLIIRSGRATPGARRPQ